MRRIKTLVWSVSYCIISWLSVAQSSSTTLGPTNGSCRRPDNSSPALTASPRRSTTTATTATTTTHHNNNNNNETRCLLDDDDDLAAAAAATMTALRSWLQSQNGSFHPSLEIQRLGRGNHLSMMESTTTTTNNTAISSVASLALFAKDQIRANEVLMDVPRSRDDCE